MKRDFREEYTNYIESDIPDLWSRIEPNLKEKNDIPDSVITANATINDKHELQDTQIYMQKVKGSAQREENNKEIQDDGVNHQQKNVKNKIVYYTKRALPIAATVAILLVGINAFSLAQKSESATMDCTPAEDTMESADEFTIDESVVEEAWEDAGAEESAMKSEEKEMYEAAPMEDYAQSAEDVTTNDMTTNDVTTNSVEEERGLSISIENATLIRIDLASALTQDDKYAYVYTFRTQNEEEISVYLTKAQCDEMEEKGVAVERKKEYSLEVLLLDEQTNAYELICME